MVSKKQPQLQGVLLDLRVTAHHKLGAVGEVDFAVEFRGHVAEELGRLLGLFLGGEAAVQHNAAAEHAEHALKNQAQALAAGVHHPGLFQHGQQLGGFLQSVGGAHAGGVPHLDGVAAQLQCLPGGGRSLATRATVRMVPSVGFITAL